MPSLTQLKNAELVVLDVEANQQKIGKDKIAHNLLEIGAIKILDGEIVDQFHFECRYEKLNDRISAILKKPKDYYNNQEFPNEREVYEKFIEWSNKAILVSFGDYDATVFESVARRYRLKKFKIFDIQKAICYDLKISNKNLPSLKGFANSLNISSDKLKHHSSKDDAKLLWMCLEKYLEIDGAQKPLFKEKVNVLERFRPIVHKSFIDEIKSFPINLDDDYKIIFDQSNIFNKPIEFDENKKPIKFLNQNSININVYNNKGQLIDSFVKEKNIFNSKDEALQNIKHYRKIIVNKYATNIVLCSPFIFDIYKEIFKEINNGKIPLIYSTNNCRVLEIIKESNEDKNKYIKVIEKINMFFDRNKKDFSNFVETDFDTMHSIRNNN